MTVYRRETASGPMTGRARGRIRVNRLARNNDSYNREIVQINVFTK